MDEHNDSGGENTTAPDTDEPLGSATPDERSDLGDTPEAHDEIIPQDLPKSHPGRKAAEKLAEQEGGATRGNM